MANNIFMWILIFSNYININNNDITIDNSLQDQDLQNINEIFFLSNSIILYFLFARRRGSMKVEDESSRARWILQSL